MQRKNPYNIHASKVILLRKFKLIQTSRTSMTFVRSSFFRWYRQALFIVLLVVFEISAICACRWGNAQRVYIILLLLVHHSIAQRTLSLSPVNIICHY